MIARVWMLRALGFVLGFMADVAYACPVCFAAKDEAERKAFFNTTVFLTFLPVLMIGGIIFWLARRARQADLLDQREDAEPGVQPAPERR